MYNAQPEVFLSRPLRKKRGQMNKKTNLSPSLTLQYGGSEMHPDTGGAILAPPSKFSKFSIFPLKKRNFWYDFFLIFQKVIMN